MKKREDKARGLALFTCLMLWCFAIGAQAAERQLHWDALDVEAHLDANGVLDVTERHTMVFTGDWNGGERIFNVRARQKLEFLGLQRIDAKTGSLHELQETAAPTNVDEFTWFNRRTLRWRSRLPSDAPFANTPLTYVLHYKLFGILLKEDEQYRIDHDFAFPDRSGPIERFSLSLDLDPVWQPLGKYQNRYMAGPLEPGESFVVNIPLHYSGSVAPMAIDISRPPRIVFGVLALLGVFVLLVLAFLARERSLGRFASLDSRGIDSAWIENNILNYPAEVVGAAWDGRIGKAEVVALIARMTAEGKLESTVDGPTSMNLSLKVDRDKLNAHEKALVDGLFFGNRTETSTKQVRQHYESRGFDPASVITPQLDKQVKLVLPPGDTRVRHWLTIVLYVVGIGLLALSSYSEPLFGGAAVALGIVSLFLVAFLQIPGWFFRSRIDWGLKAAAFVLIPATVVVLVTAGFLWWYPVLGDVDLPWTMIGGLSVLALAISTASLNGMKSRQSGDAIAFRKRLARGRRFFLKELEKPRPDLRDDWYPWLLAFGLGKQVDVWSTRHAGATTSTFTSDPSGSSNSSPVDTSWSGGGGISGGAGASGAWAAAAAGMAAGVAEPSSSGSSDSSSSYSGGSSGGGGGGGW